MSNSKVWKVLYKTDNENNWIELQGKSGYWYADPILLKRSGNVYLFTEAFCNRVQKGYLAVSKLINGKFTAPEIIMKRPFHLSYPCVFEYGQDVYMIPETGQNGTLELWKGSDDLTKWEKISILLNHVRFADTTVHIEGEKIYLISYEEIGGYKTHIFVLDMSNYRVTKIEEIVHVDNIFRPAGKLYRENGKLYRPVQYNVNSYGEKILINEIRSLHPFEEVYYKEITADEYIENLKGCNTHTLSFVDDICAVDYLTVEDLPWSERLTIIRKVRNKFYKIKFKLGL